MRALQVLFVSALVALAPALAPAAGAADAAGAQEAPEAPDATGAMEADGSQFVLTVRLENAAGEGRVVDVAADGVRESRGHIFYHQDRCWASTTLDGGEVNEFVCVLPDDAGPYQVRGAVWESANATDPLAEYTRRFRVTNGTAEVLVRATGDNVTARPTTQDALGGLGDGPVLAVELNNGQQGPVALLTSSDSIESNMEDAGATACVVTTTLNASETSRFRCPLPVARGHYVLTAAAGPVETGNVTLTNRTLYRPTGATAPFSVTVLDDRVVLQ